MKNNAEDQYLEIMRNILQHGVLKENRTGIDTRDLFGVSIRHDFKNGFPLLTTKKMYTKAIIHELIWFLKGIEDAQYLIDNKVRIWDEWMKDCVCEMCERWQQHPSHFIKKILPHTYGVKWRDFDGVDQIRTLIEQIKTNPDSRRLIVSAWDPRHVKDAALPWCHILQQYNVRGEYLDLNVYQRSSDWFLGVPFNIASYGFLLSMIADVTGYKPGEMYYTFGSAHVYMNHVDQCMKQLSNPFLTPPTLKLNHRDNIDDFVFEDFELLNYQSAKTIKAKVAV
jgi:thymidylate synthase